MSKGDRVVIANLFYATRGREGFPYEIASLADDAAIVRLDADGYALARAGRGAATPSGPTGAAALSYATADRAFLANATRFAWGNEILRADKPVNAELDMAVGRAVIDATEDCTLTLAGARRVQITKGRHAVAIPATPADVLARRRAQFAALWRSACARHKSAAQRARQASVHTNGMTELWTVAHRTKAKRIVFRALANGREEPNLAREGKASAWTAGSTGCHPSNATDGKYETYSAVSSGAPHSNALPKDLGVEWKQPVTISQVWVEHYSNAYRPALDGQDLQYWDGKKWGSIDDRIEGMDTPLWIHTFEPVTTTRVRLFITKFNTMRTAIREFVVFAQPCKRCEETVTVTQKPRDLKLFDLDGDGRAEAMVAVGDTVQVIGPDGRIRWECKLPKAAHRLDAYDLDRDGRGEVVCSCLDMKLYCLDWNGKQRWAAECPKDKWRATMTPARGYFNVVKCDDIDGDGNGEIIAGATNWFAYAFDYRGRKLWGTMNWAHPPLDIATVDLDGTGKKASLIGTRYCAANLFAYDGKRIGSVSVGYHACATSCAAGDMDGNGKPELVAGSRVGSVECREWKSDKHWSLFMGAEVTRAAIVNLVGDANPELVVGSRNSYVLAIDTNGRVIWKRNAGDSVLDVVAGDFNGDGRNEVAAGCENGVLVVYSPRGDELARAALGAPIVRMAAGDIDGDKTPDITAAAANGDVRAFRMHPQ